MKSPIHPATVVVIRALRHRERVGAITRNEVMKMTLEEINYHASELSGTEIAEINREGNHGR
jgi:DNA-binding LacI/PurR family transcriptional regulator